MPSLLAPWNSVGSISLCSFSPLLTHHALKNLHSGSMHPTSIASPPLVFSFLCFFWLPLEFHLVSWMSPCAVWAPWLLHELMEWNQNLPESLSARCLLIAVVNFWTCFISLASSPLPWSTNWQTCRLDQRENSKQEISNASWMVGWVDMDLRSLRMKRDIGDLLAVWT